MIIIKLFTHLLFLQIFTKKRAEEGRFSVASVVAPAGSGVSLKLRGIDLLAFLASEI